jgi:AraC-like DNA-binding protein
VAPTHKFRPITEKPRSVEPDESLLKKTCSSSDLEPISKSWQRCATGHHLDPGSRSRPHIVTQSELKEAGEPLSDIIAHGREEIDRLFAIVRQQGYVVLLCNDAGVAVHHRGDEARAEEFKRWGIWLGGVWSEQIEGTNGIGTCILEQEPVLVHCGQHYRARHTNLSCAGAPIFDATGKLAGVLDVSRVDSEADRTHPLALAATIASARAVEERIFREFFRQTWIIAAAPCDDQSLPLLLAVAEDQRIVGADRVARLAFSLTDTSLREGLHLSRIFHDIFSVFRRGGVHDIPIRLTRAGGGAGWNALITPPLPKPGLLRSWSESTLHSRPRLTTVGTLSIPEEPPPSRGGLSPALTHRIRDYIESHLDQKISLDDLAAMAGLSPHHFARAFRQSVGMPPHGYLLRRRLERVEQMIHNSELPLSEIALAVGFSDQSHLARHFRRATGMSPSLARRRGW